MKRLNRRESAGWTRVSVAAACGDNGGTGGEIDNGDRKGGIVSRGGRIIRPGLGPRCLVSNTV